MTWPNVVPPMLPSTICGPLKWEAMCGGEENGCKGVLISNALWLQWPATSRIYS